MTRLTDEQIGEIMRQFTLEHVNSESTPLMQHMAIAIRQLKAEIAEQAKTIAELRAAIAERIHNEKVVVDALEGDVRAQLAIDVGYSPPWHKHQMRLADLARSAFGLPARAVLEPNP